MYFMISHIETRISSVKIILSSLSIHITPILRRVTNRPYCYPFSSISYYTTVRQNILLQFPNILQSFILTINYFHSKIKEVQQFCFAKPPLWGVGFLSDAKRDSVLKTVSLGF
jgi:hypothetical protein